MKGNGSVASVFVQHLELYMPQQWIGLLWHFLFYTNRLTFRILTFELNIIYFTFGTGDSEIQVLRKVIWNSGEAFRIVLHRISNTLYDSWFKILNVCSTTLTPNEICKRPGVLKFSITSWLIIYCQKFYILKLQPEYTVQCIVGNWYIAYSVLRLIRHAEGIDWFLEGHVPIYNLSSYI